MERQGRVQLLCQGIYIGGRMKDIFILSIITALACTLLTIALRDYLSTIQASCLFVSIVFTWGLFKLADSR